MNTNLPTNITSGTTGRIADTNEAYGAINTLSRDTGRREASGFISNGWTANSLVFRRENNMGIISVTNLNGADATNDTFLTFAGASPGVSPTFVGAGTSKRSPVFRTATGGEFYFALTSNTLRCFFQNGLTSTGGFQVDWLIPYGGGWPSFLPPAA